MPDAYQLLDESIAAAERRGVDDASIESWRPLASQYRAARDWKSAAQLANKIDATLGSTGETRVGQVDGSVGAFLRSGTVFDDPSAALSETWHAAVDSAREGVASVRSSLDEATTVPAWAKVAGGVLILSVLLLSVGYAARSLR